MIIADVTGYPIAISPFDRNLSQMSDGKPLDAFCDIHGRKRGRYSLVLSGTSSSSSSSAYSAGAETFLMDYT
jgi:hypothetical protein